MPRLLTLTFDKPSMPSRKFRVEAFGPFFTGDGVTSTIKGLPDGWFARRLRLLALPAAQTLLLQKKLLPQGEFDLLRKKYPRIVYDFDDAVYLNPKAAARFEHIVRRADCVIAGNRVLAEAARAFQKAVVLLPTGLDLERYRPATPGNRETRVVGWIGSRHNTDNLHPLSTPLSGLGKRLGFELRYVSNAPDPVLDRDGWRYLPWSAETEVGDLAAFDAGLMPLADTDYNRGKCGFKIIQYMAMGVPPVASPVGFNRELIIHRTNGLLATGPGEWEKALETLFADQDLYRAMRRNALERAKDFDLKKLYPILKSALFPG